MSIVGLRPDWPLFNDKEMCLQKVLTVFHLYHHHHLFHAGRSRTIQPNKMPVVRESVPRRTAILIKLAFIDFSSTNLQPYMDYRMFFQFSWLKSARERNF